jgi:hypothetical protein
MSSLGINLGQPTMDYFNANQSALTGELFPIVKKAGAIMAAVTSPGVAGYVGGTPRLVQAVGAVLHFL